MTAHTIELSFSFYYLDHAEISNDVIFQLRRQIANMFDLCHFGEMHEDQLIPIRDEYVEREHELFMLFSFSYPPANGDLGILVTEGFSTILNFIRQIPNLRLDIRMFFDPQ